MSTALPRRRALHAIRSTLGVFALVALLALAVWMLLDSGSGPNEWKITPGPLPVSQSAATDCFGGSRAVSAVRSVGSVDYVHFAGQRRYVRLRFLTDEDTAIQVAYEHKQPWVYDNTIWTRVPSLAAFNADTALASACLPQRLEPIPPGSEKPLYSS